LIKDDAGDDILLLYLYFREESDDMKVMKRREKDV